MVINGVTIESGMIILAPLKEQRDDDLNFKIEDIHIVIEIKEGLGVIGYYGPMKHGYWDSLRNFYSASRNTIYCILKKPSLDGSLIDESNILWKKDGFNIDNSYFESDGFDKLIPLNLSDKALDFLKCWNISMNYKFKNFELKHIFKDPDLFILHEKDIFNISKELSSAKGKVRFKFSVVNTDKIGIIDVTNSNFEYRSIFYHLYDKYKISTDIISLVTDGYDLDSFSKVYGNFLLSTFSRILE